MLRGFLPRLIRATNHVNGRKFISISNISRMAVVTEVVPALGESITEGAIASWTKAIGEKVAVDDVVVVVETDKVTVDIKSTVEGVLVGQLADTDAEISVGAPLFKIDTEGTATTSAAPAASSESAAPATPPPSSPTNSASSALSSSSVSPSHGRTPLIRFTHGKANQEASIAVVASSGGSSGSNSNDKAAKPPMPPKVIKEGTGVDFYSLPAGAWHGRPQLSDSEAEAVESGGATIVW
jgi:pyruvate/2-oxoglutarate dehydrogenase complex dihydrolipoamide acyltransferase (E2) component